MDIVVFCSHFLGNILMMTYSLICWASFAKMSITWENVPKKSKH